MNKTKSIMEWISVNDRLPQTTVDVLIFVPTEGDAIYIGAYSDNKWTVVSDLTPLQGPVTHWMYLPKPPQQ